jgi:hypothetical protein
VRVAPLQIVALSDVSPSYRSCHLNVKGKNLTQGGRRRSIPAVFVACCDASRLTGVVQVQAAAAGLRFLTPHPDGQQTLSMQFPKPAGAERRLIDRSAGVLSGVPVATEASTLTVRGRKDVRKAQAHHWKCAGEALVLHGYRRLRVGRETTGHLLFGRHPYAGYQELRRWQVHRPRCWDHLNLNGQGMAAHVAHQLLSEDKVIRPGLLGYVPPQLECSNSGVRIRRPGGRSRPLRS